jgi:hypothetical protein
MLLTFAWWWSVMLERDGGAGSCLGLLLVMRPCFRVSCNAGLIGIRYIGEDLRES